MTCLRVGYLVHQLVQAARKYQNNVSESGSSGLSAEDLHANCRMFVMAGQKLGRVLELQALNDFGYSKRYIRCLQISEVVNRMKDLIDFSREQNVGPLESLKSYPRLSGTSKHQTHKLQEVEPMNQGTAMDQTSLCKMMALQSIPCKLMNSGNLGCGTLSISSRPEGLTGFQNLLRQNSINSGGNVISQEANPFVLSNQLSQQLSWFQGHSSSLPVSIHNMAMNTHNLSQPSMNPRLIQSPHPQSSQQNQQLQQHVLQHLLQDVLNNGDSAMQSLRSQNANVSTREDVLRGTSSSMVVSSRVALGNGSNNGVDAAPSRNSSFKSTASNQVTFDDNNFDLRSDSLQNLALFDLVQDISHEFAGEIFNGEPTDMCDGW